MLVDTRGSCNSPNRDIDDMQVLVAREIFVMNYCTIKEISLLKTIRMNVHYFGWKKLFAPVILCSRNVYIRQLEGTVIANNHSRLKLGFNSIGCFDEKNNRSVWQNEGNIILNGKVSLGSGTKISNGGTIVFGNGFSVSGNSMIICKEKIEFGEDSLVSWECLFMDTDLHDVLDSKGNIINESKSISIGDRVWFGCRCTVTKGTVLNNNLIVAANSGLHGRVNASNCCIGNNGIILKSDVNWKK